MMNRMLRVGNVKTRWIAGTMTALVCVLIGWQLSYVDHVSVGSSQKAFTIPVEFDRFRQIMVRNNATKAVMLRSGMTLIEERMVDIKLDTSHDRRPLINALFGRSKTNLTATKALTVSLNDPQLNADTLSLTQQAEVKVGEMHVRTEADLPTGNLEAYSSTLDAFSDQQQTSVSISINQSVRIRVPFFLKLVADRRVQAAADEASKEQEQSIRKFIDEFADDSVVSLTGSE